MVALPLAALIFPLQALVALYELLRRRSIERWWVAIAAIGGTLAGMLWWRVIQSSQAEASLVVVLSGAALFQSFTAFGCYMLVDRFAPDAIRSLTRAFRAR